MKPICKIKIFGKRIVLKRYILKKVLRSKRSGGSRNHQQKINIMLGELMNILSDGIFNRAACRKPIILHAPDIPGNCRHTLIVKIFLYIFYKITMQNGIAVSRDKNISRNKFKSVFLRVAFTAGGDWNCQNANQISGNIKNIFLKSGENFPSVISASVI